MEPDFSEELAALVMRLYSTQLMRSADEAGGVRLTFITNNRLYQITVQTEDRPTEFTLSAGSENPFMEAPTGLMQGFVRQMRVRYPSVVFGPGGPHGAASCHPKPMAVLDLFSPQRSHRLSPLRKVLAFSRAYFRSGFSAILAAYSFWSAFS